MIEELQKNRTITPKDDIVLDSEKIANGTTVDYNNQDDIVPLELLSLKIITSESFAKFKITSSAINYSNASKI